MRYTKVGDPDVGKYCGDGIPCLVLVDDTGAVISDTYRGGQYIGPEVIVDDIKKM
jgi:nucleoredoxin